ncbi:ABC transporter permease [Ferruginivarius sediminum]|uniref:ABC transporter permease n=1 Tax=Ferruginivarius sediminum TaxID=2661937 RepID=A0A369TH04_9PROT|nr:ABC transporter permease [Ferruginivarius sediminum]RDD62196.1 ABC transporter permease [Ferruginivarius sediminum]
MEFLINWLSNVPQSAVPFALAALGLIVCERSGVLNLGAEGYLLVGANAGAGAMLTTGSPMFAFVLAALAGGALSLLFALLVINLRMNQVISGLTIVFFAQGLTSLIAARNGWTSRSFSGLDQLDFGLLTDIPVLGPILFNQDAIVYLTVALFAGAVFVFKRTEIGLQIRAVGENPAAADSTGVSVSLYRYLAVVSGAMLIGLAGGYLSVGVSKIWVDDMAGGRGWIAIALMIFARWQFWPALAGAVLFGCIEALIPRVAAVGLQVPQYFVLMLPYVATLCAMVWVSLDRTRHSGVPAALGEPYVREERR